MYRPDLEAASPEATRQRQLARLNDLLSRVLARNMFLANRLAGVALPLSWTTFSQLPFTTKGDLVAGQQAVPPFGTAATYSADEYATYHQTSGTTGRPLAVPDTTESWEWWSECWRYVYAAADVTARDRILFAFSFGPFIGFWAAFAAARRMGAMTLPGGGLDSKGRLQLLMNMGATVLVCTPSYALRLAEVAASEGVRLREGSIKVTIHAGEPGASIPPVRARIEDAWGARCFDHAGGTEVGAWGYACTVRHGLHVNEAEFIAEVIEPSTGRLCGEGEQGELVVTNLGRAGWPVIRYRTGDIVLAGARSCACGRTFLTLPGGVIGRTDDLIVLRGVNVFPSAIESIVRGFDVDEFRMVRTRNGALEELTVEVEASGDVAARLADAVRERLAVRIPTRAVPQGSLPRWELKARRLVDARSL